MESLLKIPRMRIDDDVPVAMSDGVRLMTTLFRPETTGPVPAIVSVTPYGKDRRPDRIGMLTMRLAGVRFGTLDCSRDTGFEAPDPLFWTNAGYAVVLADVRGMHRSEGQAGVLTDTDAQDYASLIEWIAQQDWCTGAVGLCGVSYLAMSQWRVAALRPPHLKAIVPWEGVSDLLREFAYQDGIPETGFIPKWWKFRMQRGHNKRFPMAEDFLAEANRHPVDGPYWAAKRPALENIDVPALVCANWSDHGLHTRGSIEGFRQIASEHKWLFTHGRRKWETFYGPEARTVQRAFFDRFLKDEANGFERTPRVRLEVRRSRERYDVRFEPQWPIPGVTYLPLYLDARNGTLSPEPPAQAARATYAPRAKKDDRARFTLEFVRDTEITGEMSLTLWISTSAGNDLDLFVLVRKFDARGQEVHFLGYCGFNDDVVAKGWLRASHRELDPARSRPSRPWHTHAAVQPVEPGAVVPVQIEIWPSSTLFEAGTRLQLDVLGHDGARYPPMRHGRLVNQGTHTVHTGGVHDSHLLVPFVKPARDA